MITDATEHAHDRIPVRLRHPLGTADTVTFEYFKSSEPPEPLLLNRIFLTDLALAADHFRRDVATGNLKRYLGVTRPETRRDLLHDKHALSSAVRPALFSPAWWPGAGRHPLVVLQQAAVNLALHEPRESGILAINGPPGTGKTTLLRDIVAALVVERARVMAGLDDPEDAFLHSGQKLRAGSAWVHLYKVEERLRGFEMLVASSNNKAVENVSAELPGLSAIADDAHDLRYFPTVSNALLGRETWGLIAAVLGKAANRYQFGQAFWWDEEIGLSTYLAAASGNLRMVEVTDPVTGEATTRPPRIVTAERAPRDHEEALQRWRQTRKSFTSALYGSEAALRELETVCTLAERLSELAASEAQARDCLQSAVANETQATELSRDAEQHLASARKRVDAEAADRQQHMTGRPGFFARLFRTARFRAWREVDAAQCANATGVGGARTGHHTRRGRE